MPDRVLEVVQIASADLEGREGDRLRLRVRYVEFPRSWPYEKRVVWCPKKKRMVFDIRFKVLPEDTERTVAIAEAFGIGVDHEQEFPIYVDFELEIGPRDIIYITGPSGSGKSVLLRALEKELSSLWPLADIDDVAVEEDKPIVEALGSSLDEAIRLLTSAGLGDAFVWLRRYRELSDGQKYRFKLAKLMEEDVQMWVADEFCSTLDRDTARVVAFCTQKLARKLGKGLMVATCHTDLIEDLGPSVLILKDLGPGVEVRYGPNEPVKECSLLREVEFALLPPDGPGIRALRREALGLVEKWHYRGRRPPFKHVVVARRGGRIIGVALLSWPYLHCWGRRHFFTRGLTGPEMNEWAWCVSRIVVHPLYRGIGLGKKLLSEALRLGGKPYVELVAVMARYNPFAEKAGMMRVCEKEPDPAVLKALEELGLDRRLMGSEAYLTSKLRSMDEEGLEKVKSIISHLGNPELRRSLMVKAGYRGLSWKEALSRARPGELARLIAILASMASRKVYLIWRNPGLPFGSCPLDELVRPEWRERLLRGP